MTAFEAYQQAREEMRMIRELTMVQRYGISVPKEEHDAAWSAYEAAQKKARELKDALVDISP